MGAKNEAFFGMKRATIKWGIGGAVSVLGLDLLLIVIQESLPYGSPLWGSIHRIVFAIASPVIWIWESLGVRGEEGIRFIIPIFISIFCFLTGLGFLGGALLSRMRRS